jgi:hypothetical protein
VSGGGGAPCVVSAPYEFSVHTSTWRFEKLFPPRSSVGMEQAGHESQAASVSIAARHGH